ncbi:MAG: hypothetical protein EOQ93_31915 [Mesorhizobium sp.]|nr:MAG: hypothetical protein EOQ93_31915 [Mesorhizobium sp.]
MQKPHERQEYRRPWRVEKGQNAVAGNEAAKIANVLQAGFDVAAGQARRHGAFDHRDAELVVQPLADMPQHHPAGMFQEAIDGNGADDGKGEPQQRVDRAARQHPVIDLQHVDGAGKQKKIG